MRSAVLVLVFASFGCDKIFGVKTTHLTDSGTDGPPDAPYFAFTITGQRLDRVHGGEMISYPPVAGLTMQAGPITGPLQTITVDASGTFLVPEDLVSGEYRLVYTVPSDMPTEIHWSATSGHLVVDPMWGREPRPAPPTGAMVRFVPSPPFGPNYNDARVLTTERWTQTRMKDVGGQPAVAAYQFPYTTSAFSLSGPLTTLVGAENDTEILIDLDTNGEARGYAVVRVAMLIANTATSSTHTWQAPVRDVLTSQTGGTDNNTATRLSTALGPMYASATFRDGFNLSLPFYAGVVPSLKMPGYRPANSPKQLDQAVMFDLVEYQGTSNTHSFTNPFNGTDEPVLPTVERRRADFYRTVTVNGTMHQLFGGLQVITPVPAGNTTPTTVEQIGGIVQLNTSKLNGITMNSEDLTIPLAGMPTMSITFTTDRPVDDCVWELYRFAGATMMPVRRFLMPELPGTSGYKIESSVFTQFPAGTKFVFKTVCRVGYDFSGAIKYDYTRVTYPYASAQTFTPIFSVTP